jgi:membrane protease YdiL (CAAX protease family)
MMWILDGKFSQPFWTCIYYGLTYVLSLVLVIIVPPRVINKLKTRANAKSNKKSRSISQFTNLPNFTTSREELGLKDLPTVIDVGLAPVSYVVYLVLSGIFTSIMSAFTWFNAEETQDVGFGYFITTGDRVVAMIALVFIAPIAEEIIMRGWLYGKLREKLKIPVAMLLTSLLFGFLHGQWNVSVGVFALSLVLCGLREITGTIWSGMLLHMLSNGIAFYLLYIAI